MQYGVNVGNPSRPLPTTPEGYTYSSAFVPGPSFGHGRGHGDGGTPAGNMNTFTPPGAMQQITSFTSMPSQSWYQPGSVRCRQTGCRFMGSVKAVEIHVMDRHLVFPPDWEHRRRKQDWDADPSLKGYVFLFFSVFLSVPLPNLPMNSYPEINLFDGISLSLFL